MFERAVGFVTQTRRPGDRRPSTVVDESSFHEFQSSVGRYTILGLIGEGGMGRVYAGYDMQLRRRVALKVLKASRAGANLLREARAMAMVRHPNVVEVYDVGIHEGSLFIAMEYVNGVTLRDSMLAGGRRSFEERLRILIDAGKGLDAAHRAGLLHRDFKPSNILVCPDGRVKVADLGLAQVLSVDTDARTVGLPRVDEQSTDDDTDLVLGTPRYMAPEQILGDALDVRVDVFAFSVTAWEVVFDCPPFPDGPGSERLRAIRRGMLLRSDSPPDDVPAWFASTVRRGLAFESRKRPRTVATLVERFERRLARRRWRLAMFGVPLVAAWALSDGTAETCDPNQLAADWTARRTAIETALGSVPARYAAETSRRVIEELDDYVVRWTAARREACESAASDLHEGSADRQLACVAGAKQAFSSLLDALEQADADTLMFAQQAVGLLPELSTCNDEAFLDFGLRPPPDAATSATVEIIRTKLAETAVVHGLGRYAEALERQQELRTQALESGYPPVGVEVEYAIAQNLEALESYSEAFAAYRSLYFEARADHHDRIAAMAARRAMFVAVEHLALHEEGVSWAATADAEHRQIGDDRELAAWLSVYAVALTRWHRFDEAEAAIDRALALFSSVDERGARTLGATYNNQAALRQTRGDYSGAIESLRAALDNAVEQLGPEHPEVARRLVALAICQTQIGNAAGAEISLARALPIIEQTFGSAHPRTLSTMSTYAYALMKLGRVDKALQLSRRAVAALEKDPSVNERRTAEVRLAFAEILVAADRYEAALAQANAVSTCCDDGSIDGDRRRARAERIAAETLQVLGRCDEATLRGAEAVALAERSYGLQHAMGIVVVRSYAEILRGCGDATTALRELERIAPSIDHSSEELRGPRALLEQSFGRVYVALDQPERALFHLQRARSLADHGVLSEEDRAVISLDLGVALFDSGQFSDALRHFEEALALFEAERGLGHYRAAVVLYDIGEVKLLLGEFEAAASHLRQAIATLETTLGKEHPVTSVARCALLTALAGLNASPQAFEQARAAVNDLARQGVGHRSVTQARLDLAEVLWAIGQRAPARAVAHEGITSTRGAPEEPERSRLLQWLEQHPASSDRVRVPGDR